MSWSRFESLARRLLEDSFDRLLGEGVEPVKIATRLAKVLEESSHTDGTLPGHFLVWLHPHDYETVYASTPELEQVLATYIMELAQQAGLVLLGTPTVTVMADAAVKRRNVKAAVGTVPLVGSRDTVPDVSEGVTLVKQSKPAMGNEVRQAIAQLDAFLVVEGRRHVLLTQPTVTIGRRTDNDVVLDDAMVSRQHAQIRWRYGRFVLYDLSNRGRTAVNEQMVTEHVLQSGDVIALSGVLLVYGEGRTQPLPPLPSRNEDGGTTLLLPE